jgi:cytochrome c oxidase cbb3-type subunit 3
MNGSIPGEMQDHVYDGIREYDNPLPGWWTWLFVASCIFSFFYWIYFHLGTEGRTIHDQYDRNAADIFERRFAKIGTLTPDRETILKYMKDPEFITVGKVVYKTNCVSCHGANGEGNVGPNLTDDHWKNVKLIEDIARVIEQGAANGAMPAWRNRLSHINQIVLAAAYVASLRGTHPGGGKQAEGDPIPPWPTTSVTSPPESTGPKPQTGTGDRP